MKFVVNTAVAPHFCALFDDDGILQDVVSWSENCKDGQATYDFMTKHDFAHQDITFVGAVSGPGGFSSLRVSSGVLQSLSLKFDLKMHQIRADKWLAYLMENEDFVLNSFGSTVWQVIDDELVRIESAEAGKALAGTEINTFFLPTEKADHFINRSDRIFTDQELAENLLSVLQEVEPRDVFVPDYNFSPV